MKLFRCQLCKDNVFGVAYRVGIGEGVDAWAAKYVWVDEGCFIMLSERGEIQKVVKTIVINKKNMIEEENVETTEEVTPEEDAADEAPTPEEE